MLRSWSLTGFVLVCAVAVVATLFAQGSRGLAVAGCVVFLTLALLLSPLVFRVRSPPPRHSGAARTMAGRLGQNSFVNPDPRWLRDRLSTG